MDHTAIEENLLAERFVLGQLAPEEARRFEEHFLGCAECLERVELAEQLQGGLQRAAVRRAAAVAVAQGGLLAWWAGRRRRIALGLTVLALLLAAALPVALLLPRVRRLDRELAAIRAVPIRKQPRQQSPVQAVDPGAAEENRRLAREVAAQKEEVARLGKELETARAPQINVPILALSLLRSAGNGEEARARVRLPAAAPWLAVSLEPSDPGFPVYRAALRGSGGRVLWRGGGLTPTPAGLLSLSLPRSLLASGDYTLEVEGLPAGGAPVPAGSFPFRVTP